MGLFWDLYQESRISEAQSGAEVARSTSERLRRDVDQMRRRMDAMALACQAMWEILRDQVGVSEDALMQKMQEIDLRDGTADGRMTPQRLTCPGCSKLNNTTRSECVYCGAKLPVQHVFQKD